MRKLVIHILALIHLMKKLLDKISQLESRFKSIEPYVNAFVPEERRFERLRREADMLAKNHPDPGNRPELFGWLVGVKDIFHVDGFETHAGSSLPADVLAGPEAQAVSKLKAQGALVVGKTVTTEFAYFGPGPTRNPHNPGHTPGGSSSGSAAAVAAGLCDIALGTQTIGSVNRPAAFCGVSGYKPSYDRISKRGVIPLAGSLDHVGIFSWNTTQIEIAASNVVRNWRSDGVSRKPRIGIPVGAYLDKAEPEGRSHLEAVATELAKAGFEVSEIAAFKDFEKVFNRHQLVLAAEAARVHEKWFARYAGLYHKKTIELIEAGLKIAPEALEKAVNEIPGFRNEIMLTMEQHGIDVWLTPSAPGPAPQGLESTGNPIMNLPWTQAGLPTLTIPSGRSDSGLPLGVQVVGKWDEDEQLFSFGKAIETIIGQDLSIQDFNSDNKEYK